MLLLAADTATLLTITVLVILARWAEAVRGQHQHLPAKWLVATAVVSSLLGYAYLRSYVVGMEAMAVRGKYMSAALSELRRFPNTPDEVLRGLYPEVSIIRARAQTLSELGLILPKPAPGHP